MWQGDWFALMLSLAVVALLVYEYRHKIILVHSEERWRFRWLRWSEHPVACGASLALQCFVALGALWVFVLSW